MTHIEKLELIEEARKLLPDPVSYEPNRIRVIQYNKNEPLISPVINTSSYERVSSPYYEVEFIKTFKDRYPSGWEFSGLSYITGKPVELVLEYDQYLIPKKSGKHGKTLVYNSKENNSVKRKKV